MQGTRTLDPVLVAAAQAGDRRSLDDLARLHLPLVYTMVRRALHGHPDVDDVAQDIMLRALRQLRALRDPGSFRPWLAAIAVRQVSTYLQHRHAVAGCSLALDEVVGVVGAVPASTGVEDLAVLRAELSGQRRQVARAGRWLDPGDRSLLALWWLETMDRLPRSGLAAALGVSVAHAGVRVQRMRTQLDLSRAVVAALEAGRRCAGLDAAVAAWDGVPSPLWRKRVARHVRSCAACTAASDDLVPVERLVAAHPTDSGSPRRPAAPGPRGAVPRTAAAHRGVPAMSHS